MTVYLVTFSIVMNCLFMFSKLCRDPLDHATYGSLIFAAAYAAAYAAAHAAAPSEKYYLASNN